MNMSECAVAATSDLGLLAIVAAYIALTAAYTRWLKHVPIFDIATVLSWISGWVTLLPGDIIYTGTPGNTRKMSAGDVVEVELEHVGVLRNPVE